MRKLILFRIEEILPHFPYLSPFALITSGQNKPLQISKSLSSARLKRFLSLKILLDSHISASYYPTINSALSSSSLPTMRRPRWYSVRWRGSTAWWMPHPYLTSRWSWCWMPLAVWVCTVALWGLARLFSHIMLTLFWHRYKNLTCWFI